MKAALYQRGGDFEVNDVPDPDPGPGEVVVEVAYCGICGSDLHLIEKGMLPGGAVIGHEASGVVAKAGDGVADFKEGDPVVVMPLDPCNSCAPCQAGNTHMCESGMERNYGLGGRPGAFSNYMLTTPAMLFPVPDGLDLKAAALTEPWAVAVHGVNMLGEASGRLACILGAGPIGLLCLYALRRAGFENVLVSEPDPFRAGLAAKAGATVVDTSKQMLGKAILEAADRSPDVIADCAGTPGSFADSFSALRPGGDVLMLGIHMGPLSFMPLIYFLKEPTIRFSFGYTSRQFGESLKSLAGGAVDPGLIISSVMPLDKIGEAFDMLGGPGHAKVLIDCRA